MGRWYDNNKKQRNEEMIDLTGHGEGNNYDVLEEGMYNCLIEKCEHKKVYEQEGLRISYTIKVLGPKRANRLLFKDFDIGHNDPAKAKKAKDNLAKLAKLLGLPISPFDEYSLCGKQVNAMVTQWVNNKGEDRNSIYYFETYQQIMMVGEQNKTPEINKADIPF